MADARTELIDALAAHIGTAPLTEPEIDSLLKLASVAAHGTGERTSAPLTTFLAGIAAANAASRLDSVNELRVRAAALTSAQRDEG